MKPLNFVIGRFQLFHFGHERLIRAALSHNNPAKLVVFIGSADSPVTEDNPLSLAERAKVLRSVVARLNAELNTNVNLTILPVYDDLYDDAAWFAQVRTHLRLFGSKEDVNLRLFGSMKADTWYLKEFPEAEYTDVPQQIVRISGWTDDNRKEINLSATVVRNAIYNLPDYVFDLQDPKLDAAIKSAVQDYVPNETILSIKDNLAALKSAREQYRFHCDYKKKFSTYPYGEPTFVTVDAFVYCMGHVLMIKRRTMPGKGLWAMPGGFLEVGEHIADGIVRELQEETHLKVKTDDIKNIVVFDHPKRSKRGRIITHCGLINLPGTWELPRVKGGDDAEKAKWVKLSDITNHISFEDHASMIKKMSRLL